MIVPETHHHKSPRSVYAIPCRISLKDTIGLIDGFLQTNAGGHRLRAITVALFEAIGQHFGSYAHVRRTKATATNAPPGTAAQIECVGSDGGVVLAVESQHRKLSIEQLKGRLSTLRENNSEAIFITCGGIRECDLEELHSIQAREFVSGQNIYVTGLVPFCRTVLSLLGESGRRTFLECVCQQLERQSNPKHKIKWAELLTAI